MKRTILLIGIYLFMFQSSDVVFAEITMTVDYENKEAIVYDDETAIARQTFDEYGNFLSVEGEIPNGEVKVFYNDEEMGLKVVCDGLSNLLLEAYVYGFNTECYVYFDDIIIRRYCNTSPYWYSFDSEINQSQIGFTYGSPIKMEENDEWQWSNFIWQNINISYGNIIGWRIFYKDLCGNIYSTNIMSFKIGESIKKHLVGQFFSIL